MIGHNTEVGIIPKMFHRQSAKGNRNLWLFDQKSIGFILWWWWTYVWSLKVIGQKHKSVSRLQEKVLRNHVLIQSSTSSPNHRRTAALIYYLQRFFEGKMRLLLGLLFSTSQRTFYLRIWCFKKTFTYTSSKIQHLYLESRKYLKYYYSFFFLFK